jgi:hypothetical protein
MAALAPSHERVLTAIRAELARVIHYDDESVVHAVWVRQRYDCGCYASYAPARQAAVRTAWHEAGHAVAAIVIGASFSSASIHHGHRSEGRVHRVTRGGDKAFVVDSAGQVAEGLMHWTLPGSDLELRAWLRGWRKDGDAQRFRRGIGPRFGTDETAAWRYCTDLLTPHRLNIRNLARALLVHPRHLPYPVAAALVSETPTQIQQH